MSKANGKPAAPATPAKVMLTSKVLHAGWASLLEQCVPPDTHPNLVKTYKRFYFAGAKGLLDHLLYSDVLDGETDGITPSDVNRVDALEHELNQFFTEVGAGPAVSPDPQSARIMSAIDRMPRGFRALVHEFGFKIVDAMMGDGYDDAAELRTVLEGWRDRRQEQWLKTDFCRMTDA